MNKYKSYTIANFCTIGFGIRPKARYFAARYSASAYGEKHGFRHSLAAKKCSRHLDIIGWSFQELASLKY